MIQSQGVVHRTCKDVAIFLLCKTFQRMILSCMGSVHREIPKKYSCIFDFIEPNTACCMKTTLVDSSFLATTWYIFLSILSVVMYHLYFVLCLFYDGIFVLMSFA